MNFLDSDRALLSYKRTFNSNLLKEQRFRGKKLWIRHTRRWSFHVTVYKTGCWHGGKTNNKKKTIPSYIIHCACAEKISRHRWVLLVDVARFGYPVLQYKSVGVIHRTRGSGCSGPQNLLKGSVNTIMSSRAAIRKQVWGNQCGDSRRDQSSLKCDKAG